MRRLNLLISLLVSWIIAGPAWADGPQFNGTCTAIAWTQNTETDLAGYRIYDRVSLTATPTRIKEVGTQVTSLPCSSFSFNAGQHYVSITAYDSSGNESAPSAEIPFVIAVSNAVTDLRVSLTDSTSVTLSFTVVDDGAASPTKYDVRYATPTIDWATNGITVTSGTCSTPVAGSTIGATKTCTVTGLSGTTSYQFQLVPYRGTLGSTAVFGPLSNIANGTTGSAPPPGSGRYLIASDTFNRADNADLGGSWDPVGGSAWQIVSNAIRGTGATPSYANEIHTAVLPDRQWAQAIVKTITGTADLYTGLELRKQSGADSGYVFLAKRGTVAGDGSVISKRTAGASVNLASESSTIWAAGDVLRAEADGSTLRLYRNDVLVLSVVDETYASGSGGVWEYLDGGAIGNMELDEYSSGGFSNRITLVSDQFDRSDAADLGDQWAPILGYPLSIVSNAIQPPVAGPIFAAENNTGILPLTQWAQIGLTTIAGAADLWMGVQLRASEDPSVRTSYQFVAAKGSLPGSVITLRINGVFIRDVATESSTVWANGDTLRAEAENDQLRLYRNDVLILTGTDGTLTTGQAGIWAYLNAGAATNVQMDAFSAGTLVQGSADVCGCDNH